MVAAIPTAVEASGSVWVLDYFLGFHYCLALIPY